MKQVLATLCLSLFLLPVASGQTTGGAADPNSESARAEAGIGKVMTAFIEAWNKHDAKAFSMIFAEDADFTNIRGMSARGRVEIERFHAPMFATRFKDTVQKITQTKVRLIKPDVAAVDAWWEMTGAKGPEGQDTPLRRGLLNFVLNKERDRWLILVMHNLEFPVSP